MDKVLSFLWIAGIINSPKTPLTGYFGDLSHETLCGFDPGVVIRIIKDKKRFKIVIWSKPPSVLLKALPDCPHMHPTFIETQFTMMYDLIRKASSLKSDTVPFGQDRFEKVLKALQKNMEKKE